MKSDSNADSKQVLWKEKDKLVETKHHLLVLGGQNLSSSNTSARWDGLGNISFQSTSLP